MKTKEEVIEKIEELFASNKVLLENNKDIGFVQYPIEDVPILVMKELSESFNTKPFEVHGRLFLNGGYGSEMNNSTIQITLKSVPCKRKDCNVIDYEEITD